MSDGVVRWPDRPAAPGRVAVITVSYNTRELTALLLEQAVRRGTETGAAIVGESWWDAWDKTYSFLAYSLLIDPVRPGHPGLSHRPQDRGGDGCLGS